MGATIAFGSVVRKAKRSFVVSPSLTFRTDVQRVQMPAKNASGRLSWSANQTGRREPSDRTSFSAKLLKGTTAAALDAEPSAPVRRGDVADVRDAPWMNLPPCSGRDFG